VKEVFNYQCNKCGHMWTWAYLFVIKCPKCKQYAGFGDPEGQVKGKREFTRTSPQDKDGSASPASFAAQGFFGVP